MSNGKLKIAFAGSNGFFCKELMRRFAEEKIFEDSKVEFFEINRMNCDLSDSDDVIKYYRDHGNFDIIINGAVVNSRGKDKKRWTDVRTNLSIYNNIIDILCPKILIDFNSGAALETNSSHLDPYCVYKETTLRDALYTHNLDYDNASYYGEFSTTSVYSFIIFGAIGELEDEDRFFKSIIKKRINGEVPKIANRVMSFVYIDDIYKAIRNLVLCYCRAYGSLSSIVRHPKSKKYPYYNYDLKTPWKDIYDKTLYNIFWPSNVFDHLWKIDLSIRRILREEYDIIRDEGDIGLLPVSPDGAPDMYAFDPYIFSRKFLSRHTNYHKEISTRTGEKFQGEESEDKIVPRLADSNFEELLFITGDKPTTFTEICKNMIDHILEENK